MTLNVRNFIPDSPGQIRRRVAAAGSAEARRCRRRDRRRGRAADRRGRGRSGWCCSSSARSSPICVSAGTRPWRSRSRFSWSPSPPWRCAWPRPATSGTSLRTCEPGNRLGFCEPVDRPAASVSDLGRRFARGTVRTGAVSFSGGVVGSVSRLCSEVSGGRGRRGPPRWLRCGRFRRRSGRRAGGRRRIRWCQP